MQLSGETGQPDIAPDTKDWTWVIAQGCPECGWHPPEPNEVAGRTVTSIPRGVTALSRADVTVRSDPAKWSTLEYACHVRDV